LRAIGALPALAWEMSLAVCLIVTRFRPSAVDPPDEIEQVAATSISR